MLAALLSSTLNRDLEYTIESMREVEDVKSTLKETTERLQSALQVSRTRSMSKERHLANGWHSFNT